LSLSFFVQGAYALMLEDDDAEMEKFNEMDIDQLLNQRSHKIVTEGQKTTSSWLNKKKKAGKTKRSRFTGDQETVSVATSHEL
jgi:hypothetical protein